MTRRKQEKRQRPNLGLLGFILALFILAFLAYFLQDSLNVPYGYLLSVIWVVVAIVTFVFGVIYFAQFITPLPGNEGWWEALRLILRADTAAFGQFMAEPRPRKTKRKRRTAAQTTEPVRETPYSLEFLRAGLIRSFQVLSIVKDNSYIRPAGPGFVILYRKEGIRQVIDLRTHLRSALVKVNTRDAIRVEAGVTVIFRVKQSEADHSQTELLFPFEREAIFHLSYDDSVNHKGETYRWLDQVVPRAAALAVQELAQYTLDDLIHVPLTAVSPRQEVGQRISTAMKREFGHRGIEVITISIGVLMLPEEVQKQNIKTWQAEWQRKIKIEEAIGEADVIRRMKQARAHAQIEIIETIIQNLQTMRQENESDMYQVITLRLIDALEEAVADNSLRTLVPQQIMTNLVSNTSAYVQSQINDPLLMAGKADDSKDEVEVPVQTKQVSSNMEVETTQQTVSTGSS